MTEALCLAIGVFIGAWLMYAKKHVKSPIPGLNLGAGATSEPFDETPRERKGRSRL